jgi:hypothetical protein
MSCNSPLGLTPFIEGNLWIRDKGRSPDTKKWVSALRAFIKAPPIFFYKRCQS